MGLFQDIQQLPDVFLAEGDGFAVIEDEAGDAHHIVGFPKFREVVDIKYLCGNVFVFRGNSLGGGDSSGHMVQFKDTSTFISFCPSVWMAALTSASRG